MGHFMAEFRKDVPSDNSPAWKRLYEAAVLELDNSKLPERIAEARRAIHDRPKKHWRIRYWPNIVYSTTLSTLCRYLRRWLPERNRSQSHHPPRRLARSRHEGRGCGVRSAEALRCRLMRCYPVSTRINSVAHDDAAPLLFSLVAH